MNVNEALPPGPEAFEIALAKALAVDLPVPLQDSLTPANAATAFLPFLAAHESVDLWFSDWSVERKRAMIADAVALAGLVGRRAAAERFLEYVDAQVLDKVSYPARFVMGMSALGITPINHPPFKTRYLIKVALRRPFNALVFGQTALGRAAPRRVNLEPIRRAKLALEISKSPDTEYLVSFGWRRPITFGDAPAFGDGIKFNQHVQRDRL